VFTKTTWSTVGSPTGIVSSSSRSSRRVMSLPVTCRSTLACVEEWSFLRSPTEPESADRFAKRLRSITKIKSFPATVHFGFSSLSSKSAAPALADEFGRAAALVIEMTSEPLLNEMHFQQLQTTRVIPDHLRFPPLFASAAASNSFNRASMSSISIALAA
jgi:hypothetical protein